jgi:hypothetical protein
MTTDSLLRLADVLVVEDAEPLVAALDAAPGARLDLGDVTAIHTAVLQVLIAFRPTLAALPRAPDVIEVLASSGLVPDGLRHAA